MWRTNLTLHFVQISIAHAVLFWSVSQPLAPAHIVGLTQCCSGRAPRITRCLRFECSNGERSDITGWSVVSRKTHGERKLLVILHIHCNTVYSLTAANQLGIFILLWLLWGNSTDRSKTTCFWYKSPTSVFLVFSVMFHVRCTPGVYSPWSSGLPPTAGTITISSCLQTSVAPPPTHTRPTQSHLHHS